MSSNLTTSGTHSQLLDSLVAPPFSAMQLQVPLAPNCISPYCVGHQQHPEILPHISAFTLGCSLYSFTPLRKSLSRSLMTTLRLEEPPTCTCNHKRGLLWSFRPKLASVSQSSPFAGFYLQQLASFYRVHVQLPIFPPELRSNAAHEMLRESSLESRTKPKQSQSRSEIPDSLIC